MDGEDWDFEDLVASHAEVREEMSRRALRHLIQDELENKTHLISQTVPEPNTDTAKQVVAEAPLVTGASSSQSLVIFEQEIADDLDKGVRQAFGSYGGKRFLAHRIASYIPHHRTYVEPFAGGAAVLYAKDPSPQEAAEPDVSLWRRAATHDRQHRIGL